MGAPRFGKRRWRRPERLTLEHPPVVRRKDLGVSEPLAIETELARRASRRQLEVLLVAFIVLSVLEGLIIGLLSGLGWTIGIATFVLAIVYFFVAREFGDGWIVRVLRARTADGPRVLRLAASEAKTAGIPTPRLLVVPGDPPNALSFALRRRWLVTTEGSERLEELALEGLLAHEIIHLRDGESSVASLYVALAGAPDLVLRGAGLLTLLSIPLWPALLVLRALRSVMAPADREHRADIAAAMLTRYPPGIQTALEEAGGPPSTFRMFDPFWFVPRGTTQSQDAKRRAELVGEM